MKTNIAHIGLAKLCGWFGISRQAYYRFKLGTYSALLEDDLVLQGIKQIRINHPKMGARKLYVMLQPFLLEHKIKMGRDKLFNILSANNLLVRNRKRRITTTNSSHWLKKYPNHIRVFVASAPNTLWVSDMTY